MLDRVEVRAQGERVMTAWRLMGVAAAMVLLSGLGISQNDAEAQGRHRRHSAPHAGTIWYDSMQGWQVGIWGAPGDYRWEIHTRGDGTITLPSRPRTGGRRTATYNFQLTAAEHVRFADLIGRFTHGEQATDLCATDQAQDIVQWRGGPRGDGLFNFDRGCTDAANQARLALLDDALTILRTAAERRAAS
jgi:hypothetical protein